MMSLPEVASLWIGEHLSFLERLCLKSFADMGHHVTLYTYGELKDRPDFVTIRDAREIYDDDRIISHDHRRSPAIHADIFRIKMLRKTDKIWVDADAYCLRPFQKRDGYLLGRVEGGLIGSGVMALPRSSEALRRLDEFLSTRGALPPWWDAQRINDYTAEFGEPDFSKMKWGVTGPIALTRIAEATGEAKHAEPIHVLYPLPMTLKRVVLRRPAHSEKYFKDDTISVHFYATGLRKLLKTRWISSESYLASLCRKHDISFDPPAGHPSLTATPPPVARAAPPKGEGPAPRPIRKLRNLALRHVQDLLLMSSPTPLKYVQVGANDGKIADPFYEMTSKGGIQSVMFEPSPIYFNALSALYKDNDLVQPVNVGVSDTDSATTLFQLNPKYVDDFPDWARGCATLYRDKLEQTLSREGPVSADTIIEVDIALKRLDGLLDEFDANDASLLLIDVEGHEPAVFRSFEFGAFSPLAVMFEHSHLGVDDLAAIHDKLKSADYRMFAWKNDTIAFRSDWLSESLVDVLRELFVNEVTS